MAQRFPTAALPTAMVRVSILAGSLAPLLALLLLAHVATCAPCYDDDVCASARIESALQLSAIKIEIGDAEGSRAANELDKLPADSAIEQMLADYQVMRDEARACQN